MPETTVRTSSGARCVEDIYTVPGAIALPGGDRLTRAFMEAISSDDEELDLTPLHGDYMDGGAAFRAGINAALIALTGYSMPGLIGDAQRLGEDR